MSATALYDPQRWGAAHKRYVENPKSLTDADIDQLAVTTQSLADRARAKRAGYVPKADPTAEALRKTPVNLGTLHRTLDDLVYPILSTYKHRIEELLTRLDALEARGAGSAVEYGGTFEQGKAYRRGLLVTRSGGLWLSLRDTVAAPGADPSSWKLIVKEGHAR